MSAVASDPAELAAVRASPRTSPERETWRLVLGVTVPFWAYLALMRVVVFMLMTAGNPGIVIAPPGLRLLQHVVLLPLLIVFYRLALAVGWPESGRVLALVKHASMAVIFALVARPVLVVLVAADLQNWSLLGELFDSTFGRRLSVDLWVSTGSDFLLSYVLGLAILLGVRNFRELKYQKLHAANLQAAATRARLQALRMQLNPHFLFNTLNAAVALVGTQPQAAEQMLVRLADLLRRTLRDGEADLISVAREAEFLRSYLEIQSLRFRDRLRFGIEVDPATRHAAVPSLVLQPLAENAVVHGIAADTEQIRIDVRVSRVPAGLELTVRNSAAAPPRPDGRLGVGLGNTRARLEALYGSDWELELVHAEEGSVTARVRIPFVELASPEPQPP